MAETISASLVKELRDRTGAGMMECKKALQECAGNLNEAEDWIAKHGMRKVQKTASRVAAEGIIVSALSPDAKQGVLIEVNSETDFVARDQQFNQFCQQVALTALNVRPGEDQLETLGNLPLSGSDKTVETARQELVARIGENIQIRRFVRLDAKEGSLATYIHGGRIGVLVHLQQATEPLAKDIAMHIAASNPEVIRAEEVPEARLDKEKEIFMAQAIEQGKSAQIAEKMVAGRLQKLVNELCLLGQPYIKDPDLTVGDLLKKTQSSVVSFTRYVVGEGIEKKQIDFASEVMAQVRGSSN